MVARFSNLSATASNLGDIQTSTPITITSTSSSATTDALTYSTPSALDQGFSTATLDDSSSSTTLNTASTPATLTTAVSMTSNSNAQSTPSFVAPPVVKNDQSQAQSSDGTSSEVLQSGPATSTRATTGISKAIMTASASLASTSLASTAPLVEIPAANTYQFAPVTVASTTSGAPRPLSTVQYPNAQNGNAAMASGFNQVYKTLSETSSCDATDTNQAFSCISGELAQCQSDGTYVLKSCPQGQSCYALPLPSGQTGISVECAVPGNAASRLAVESSATTPSASAVSQASTVSQALTVAQTSAVSQASPTVQLSSTQNIQNVQGGFVVGGFNTPITKSVQQQAQTTASLPSAEADSNSQAETSIPQKLATTPSARTATPTFMTTTTLQKVVSSTTASRAENADALNQPSASQTATETPASTVSHIPSAKAGEQFPSSQVTTVVKPVDQSSEPQDTIEVPRTTAASEAKNTQTENRPSATVTTSEESSPTVHPGPLFSVLTPDPSSTPTKEEHQAQPTPTSILALPAAAKDSPEITPTKGAGPAGITIVPMTPPPANNNNNDNNSGNNSPLGTNNVVNEKVVVNGSGNSPIYITVTTTVTTTAHDPVATA